MKRPAHTLIPAVALLGAALTAPACEPAGPERTVPDSTIVDVLVDLHLAGARERLGVDVPAGLRDSVLARHGLDSSSFRSAMAFFEAHPDEYVAVYGTVVDQLNAERDP